MTVSHRQRLWSLLKLLLGLGLVAVLVWQAMQGERVGELLNGPKNWWLLAASAGFVGLAVILNFVRWWLLVHATGLPMGLAEAMRLGALGHAANFVAPGSVGGDLLKAVLFARNHAGRRSAAVTTVLADRFLGLLTLLTLAAVAAVYATYAGLLDEAPIMLRVGQGVVSLTLITWVAAAAAFLPGPHARWLARWLPKIPVVGHVLGEVFAAVQAMGRKPENLPAAILCSVVSHILLVMSFICVAAALPLQTPDLAANFAAVPLAELAGALPIFPGGLGVTEGTLELLYRAVGADEDAGLFTALGQRLANISIGVLAMLYYLTQREKIHPAMEEAEALA